MSCTDDYTARVALDVGLNKSAGDEATDPAFASTVTVIHVELDDSVALIEVFGEDIDGRVSARFHNSIEVHTCGLGRTDVRLSQGSSVPFVRDKRRGAFTRTRHLMSTRRGQ